jgi:hypothetical protein
LHRPYAEYYSSFLFSSIDSARNRKTNTATTATTATMPSTRSSNRPLASCTDDTDDMDDMDKSDQQNQDKENTPSKNPSVVAAACGQGAAKQRRYDLFKSLLFPWLAAIFSHSFCCYYLNFFRAPSEKKNNKPQSKRYNPLFLFSRDCFVVCFDASDCSCFSLTVIFLVQNPRGVLVIMEMKVLEHLLCAARKNNHPRHPKQLLQRRQLLAR